MLTEAKAWFHRPDGKVNRRRVAVVSVLAVVAGGGLKLANPFHESSESKAEQGDSPAVLYSGCNTEPSLTLDVRQRTRVSASRCLDGSVIFWRNPIDGNNSRKEFLYERGVDGGTWRAPFSVNLTTTEVPLGNGCDLEFDVVRQEIVAFRKVGNCEPEGSGKELT